MMRFVTGAASAIALVMAGFFIWKGRAASQDPVPQAPAVARAAAAATEYGAAPLFGGRGKALPPSASEKSKEEKRFDRADRNNDGKIMLAELYEPRRKAFAKLDLNGDGQLGFAEWATSTSEKFAGADADHSGWLTRAEWATTAPKTKPKPVRCAC
jgi:hypothetical protein